jgi:hypothetical protein
MNEKQFRNDKPLFTRIAESLFGVPPQKKLTKMDVHALNGYVYIGEYALTPEEAIDVAVEILRRAK